MFNSKTEKIWAYLNSEDPGETRSLVIQTTIYKTDNQQGTNGSYTQYSVITYKGKESEKIYICIFITESLCCKPKINMIL